MALDFFTFTRNSVATQLLEDGTLSNIAVDVPVINYVDGQFAGYYSQRSATNLVTSTFTDTPPAPLPLDPTNTFGARTTTGVTNVSVSGLDPTKTYTARCWLYVPTIYDRPGWQIRATLASSTVSSQNANLAIRNEWQFLQHTFTGSDGVTFRTNGSGGDQTVTTALVMVEEGSVATSFIAPNTTRSADVATLSNASDLISQTAGSVQVTALFPNNYPLNINGLQATVSGEKTIRFEYSPTEIKLFVDNTLVDSDTGTYDWSTLDEIQLGHFDGDDQPNFELRDLIVRKA